MNHAKRLDKVSSILFLTGILIAKFRVVPFFLVALITDITSLLLYLIGYLLWIIACHLYPDYPRKKGSWYGFSQFKEQSRVAATIGVFAIFGCFIAFVTPLIILPTMWLFVVTNSLWSIAEFHKMRNPPLYDKEYSSTQQESYFTYALLMTSLSILTAITTTTVIFFPAITIVGLTVSTILGILLGLAALHSWIDCNFSDHQPDILDSQSYQLMTTKLSSTNDKEPSAAQVIGTQASNTSSFAPLFSDDKLTNNEPPKQMAENELIGSLWKN